LTGLSRSLRISAKELAMKSLHLGSRTVFAIVLAGLAVALTADSAGARESVRGRQAMVVSVCREASEVGVDLMKRGGNAVDAAVGVALALAVTFPEAGNIGGGGFMVVHPGRGATPVVIDYREVAPAAATRELFAELTSRLGHKAVGVPGTVRGLALAHGRFGSLPWRDVVQPAVRLADEGFALDVHLAESLNRIVAESRDFDEFCRVYGPRDEARQWQEGDILVQPELGRSLRRIAESGPDAFYRGVIADLIAEEMRRGGGLIGKEDLAAYRAIVREPAHTTFRGYDVYCPPAPSGGPVLIEMLNILENFDLKQQGRWSAATMHSIVESMRLAYFDRACFLADPRFVEIPRRLASKAYARELAAAIDPRRAGDSERLARSRQIELPPESPSTTHFSIIDADGMAVSNTYTLEQSFGSRVAVRGAGFILNNEMGDFGWRPGVTDRNGTIGTEPNLIEPGKRMLSSQTPTIVLKDGRPVLITGSPGGRTIINTVLQVLLNTLEFDMDLVDAIDAPRFHHQWFPDQVKFERKLLESHPQLMQSLSGMGHHFAEPVAAQGDAHSIWIDWQAGVYHGAADLRRHGCAVGL
jgi:gamma-glutamyltranspeptidase/glutathione hydrolase